MAMLYVTDCGDFNKKKGVVVVHFPTNGKIVCNNVKISQFMNVLNYDREANLDFCEKLFIKPSNSSSIFNVLDRLV